MATRIPPELFAQIPLVNLLLVISEHALADEQTPEQYKAQLDAMRGGPDGIQAMKARVAAVELPTPGSGA